jgi:hypothetical protein
MLAIPGPGRTDGLGWDQVAARTDMDKIGKVQEKPGQPGGSYPGLCS